MILRPDTGDAVVTAREMVIGRVLRLLQAERLPPSDATGDWELDYVDDELANACKVYTQAVEQLPAADRPIGWPS
jgi:hypothetical protein